MSVYTTPHVGKCERPTIGSGCLESSSNRKVDSRICHSMGEKEVDNNGIMDLSIGNGGLVLVDHPHTKVVEQLLMIGGWT